MKRTFSLVTTLSLAGMIAVSCSSLKKMGLKAEDIQYNVTPSVLEEKNDMVDVEISVTIPAKYFNKNATLVATPVLKYEGGETAFEPKTLQGENVKGNNTVIPYETAKTITYTGQVAYADAMRISDLYVKFEASKGEKKVNYDSKVIASGVVATAKLLVNDSKVADGTDQFVRNTVDKREASLFFLKNSAEVRNSAAKTDEMAAMESFIKEVKAAENLKFQNVEIQSFASPEGAYDYNENLAGKREKSSESSLKGTLKKNKVKDYANNLEFFKKYIVAEDWEGFRAALEASDIQDKELILRVLSQYTDPETRESEIRKLASAYTSIENDILPKLRRSKYVINVEKIGHSDEELKTIVKNNPKELNIEEILFAATLFESNDDKLAIYKEAQANFPKDWRGHNDVGVVLFEMGKADEAEANFNKAAEIDANNKIVANNLAAVALKNKDFEKAEVLLGTATDGCEEVNYNKGIVAIEKGDYKAAVTYFGEDNSLNAALANLLAGNNADAAKKIDASKDESALASYLKAIIAARNNDADAVCSNLATACEKDASYKAYATKDAEFLNFSSTAKFQEIVK